MYVFVDSYVCVDRDLLNGGSMFCRLPFFDSIEPNFVRSKLYDNLLKISSGLICYFVNEDLNTKDLNRIRAIVIKRPNVGTIQL